VGLDVEVSQSSNLGEALPRLGQIVNFADISDSLHSLGGSFDLEDGPLYSLEVSVDLTEAIFDAVPALLQLCHVVVECAIFRNIGTERVYIDIRVVLLANIYGVLVNFWVLFVKDFNFFLSRAEGAHKDTKLLPTGPQTVTQEVNIEIYIWH